MQLLTILNAEGISVRAYIRIYIYAHTHKVYISSVKYDNIKQDKKQVFWIRIIY